MQAARTSSRLMVLTPERRVEAEEDIALVERVRGGDAAAFDRLVLKYRERVYGVVYHLCGNREDALDLTQDAFIRAFRNIGRFAGQSSFFTWIYRIAVNHTLTHLRRNRWRRFLSLEPMRLEEAPAELREKLTVEDDQGQRVLARELSERLNEALQKLSFEHRTVVTLFEIEGMSHREICDIMGCSEGTVRSRLHYAKKQLRRWLRDYVT